MYVLVYSTLDTVCFSKPQYSVTEGRSVRIDVVANRQVQRTISIRMSYIIVTASSK